VFDITGESDRMGTHRAHADKLRRATPRLELKPPAPFDKADPRRSWPQAGILVGW
jgi:hypothetical protein